MKSRVLSENKRKEKEDEETVKSFKNSKFKAP
jgi:hypothetical protein